MQTFPEITSSSIFTSYFWESLFAYIQQSLPVVRWHLIPTLDFWQHAQNIFNLYFYLGIGAIPISFLTAFFWTTKDEERLNDGVKAIFAVSALIIPLSLLAIFILVNGYQSVAKSLRGM